MKNKFLSIVLVIFILLSIIPVSASASTSGTCGDNLIWNYDSSTYTLTISGTGAMDNYYPDDINEIYPPWKSYINQIQTIIISDGVTAIGSNAFQNCGNTISLIIPDSVNEIGENAFNNCKSLKSVVIPDSVTTIGSGAFSGCNKLTSITIPDSVTSIGASAFSGTGWYNNGKNWEDDVLYINNHLISAKENLSGTYIIKDGTKTIGGDAFALCRSLVSVVIPDSVITIGKSAFDNCWALGNVTFGNGVVSIDDYAFFNCDNLSDIAIPEGVEYIGSRAFDCCDGIAQISIPASVKSIGSDMVNHCNKLAFIDVNSNNEYYSNDEHGVLFNKDKTLLIEYPKNNSQKEYAIPDSVTEIGEHSFYPCENLRNVTFGDGVKIIGKAAFAYCNGFIEVIIPEGITKIGSQAFYGCSSLANVVIGDGVELIGREAFCSSDLYSITIPDSIKTIGNGAFNSCEKLSEVYYEGAKSEWNAISIGVHNEDLLNATIYFKKCEHDYISAVTPPTCTEQGYTTYTCECGDTYVADEVDALGHKYVTTVTTKATLTENGKKTTKCTACGDVSKITTIYSPTSFKLSTTQYTYNKTERKPKVTIKDSVGNTLIEGTDYRVGYEDGRILPGRYTVKITFIGKYDGVQRLYFTIKPRVTSKITATQTITTLTLNWKKITGATLYRIYMYNPVTDSFEYFKSSSDTTLKIKELAAGTVYKFKVRAYTYDDGKIYGAYSSVFETATKTKTPSITDIYSKTTGKAVVKWSEVSGETGYQVYYSTSKNGTYKALGSYKANQTTVTKSKLTSGKTYYFKVRAYKKTDSGTVYSSWSSVKSVKIK